MTFAYHMKRPRGKDTFFQVTLQEELNDLLRDVELPEDGAELLTSFIKKELPSKRC